MPRAAPLSRSHTRSLLELLCGAPQGWASPVPSLAALGRVTSEQPPSCSRSVSTSSAAHGNSEKVHRRTRDPIPKSMVFNKTTYKAWVESGLDMGLAQQMLALLDAPSAQRSLRDAQTAIKPLVRSAGTLQEMGLLADQVGDFMAPELIAKACVRTTQLANTALEDPKLMQSTHPLSIEQDTSAVLHTLLTRLPDRLHTLAPAALADIITCLPRCMTDMHDVQKKIAEALLHDGAFSLAQLPPWRVASVTASAAQLNWHQAFPAAWAQLTQAACARVSTADAPLVEKLASAACTEQSPTSPLWAHVTSALREHSHTWMTRYPATMANIIHDIARSTLSCPVDINALTDALLSPASKDAVKRTPPRGLARLAFALPVLAARDAGGAEGSVRQAWSQLAVMVTPQVARMSLRDLTLILGGLSALPSIQPTPPIAHVIRDVVAVRGLSNPASVRPTLDLIDQLVHVQGPQQALLKLLSTRIPKLPPCLTPDELTALCLCWAQHATPDTALTTLSHTAPTILTLTHNVDPTTLPTLTGPLLTTLHALAIVLAKAGGEAGAGVGQLRGLQGLAREVADVLVGVGEVVNGIVQGEAEQSAQLVGLLKAPGVGLGDHGLLEYMQAR